VLEISTVTEVFPLSGGVLLDPQPVVMAITGNKPRVIKRETGNGARRAEDEPVFTDSSDKLN